MNNIKGKRFPELQYAVELAAWKANPLRRAKIKGVDLLLGLNPSQAQAAVHFQGPALVLAGAGSGKTRTVVHRVAYLIKEQGIYPNQILAVTFTNKAAGELKQRLANLLEGPASELWVATFHAAALKILRWYGGEIGLKKGFPVLDSDDQTSVVKQVLREMGLEAKPGYILSLIDQIKNHPQGLSGYLFDSGEWLGGLPRDKAVAAYQGYQARLARLGGLDFNDLISKASELLETNPSVAERVRAKARFIQVDEYQDTNPAQYRFTHLLAGENRNLLVVGDPDQSIYGFRSADIANILHFSQDYPGAVTYRLLQNYRSRPPILQAADALIQQNASRLEKVLEPVREGGKPVALYAAQDSRSEAAFVVREVTKLLKEGLNYRDMVVLYRTNAQSRILEESCQRASIPFRVVGGLSFYQRREIKDLLAYARVAVYPEDDVAMGRILNVPPRGIGDTTRERLETWARARGVPLYEAIDHAHEILPRPEPVLKLGQLLASLRDLASLEVGDFLRAVAAETGYLSWLEQDPERNLRLENLEELLVAAGEYEEDLISFLDQAALTAKADQEAGEESLTLMTLHTAKGLEFPVVFIVGLEEGLLPHRSSILRLDQLEEERRLLYVGMTRAMERLYLSYAENREIYGRSEPARPSRFLEEIPRALLRPAEEEPLLPKSPVLRPRVSPTLSDFRPGQRVEHTRYGVGVVVGVAGSGTHEEVSVEFPQIGVKKLLARYAGLKAVPE